MDQSDVGPWAWLRQQDHESPGFVNAKTATVFH